MDYDAALDRAYDELPDRTSDESARLSVPDPVGETDGAFTRLTNIGAIADALGRDADHLHSAIQRALGTSGQFDGDRARYNGSFDAADFEAAVDDYVAEFVTCSECGLPDTILTREDGIEMLRCQACGAFRPVEKRTAPSSQATQPTLEEGETYFVPGAREGQSVTALIESINGDLAFARLV
jgi:translation initiation factor 2 subunit 2